MSAAIRRATRPQHRRASPICARPHSTASATTTSRSGRRGNSRSHSSTICTDPLPTASRLSTSRCAAAAAVALGPPRINCPSTCSSSKLAYPAGSSLGASSSSPARAASAAAASAHSFTGAPTCDVCHTNTTTSNACSCCHHVSSQSRRKKRCRLRRQLHTKRRSTSGGDVASKTMTTRLTPALAATASCAAISAM